MFLWDAPPAIVGHRGSPREATENTIASFEAAARAGARAVELDARLAADGVVVVHHDPELGRVIPGQGEIEGIDSTELHVKGIPRLADVLDLARDLDLALDVEIKADTPRAAEIPGRVLELVRAAHMLDRVLVTSFDPEIADAYARLADRPAGGIYPFAPEVDDLSSFPRLRFSAIAEEAALPDAIAALRSGGQRVLVWTVNDPASAAALLNAGAESIITDRPGPLLRARGAGASAP